MKRKKISQTRNKWKVENCSYVINRHIEKMGDREKIIEQERIETKSISKTVQEKEKIIDQITQTMDILNHKNLTQLISTSKVGMFTQCKIQSQLREFMMEYPWKTLMDRPSEDLLIIGKESFSCVPFVLVTWVDLINSGIGLQNYEIAHIIQLKLVWRAMKLNLHDTVYNSKHIIARDQETVQMTVISFTEGVATINLMIPSLSIDVYVDLPADACFLMTIPCENSSQMILHNARLLRLSIPRFDRT